MTKVSVIVPVYGTEKYIERCARSLFDQTLDDIEYLFIDDCTPDRSIELLCQVLKEYPQRKKQVIIHRMEHNSGQAKVREWGMRNASGEYVIHCDSDDWVNTDMYRAMYEKAKEDDSDVVVCDYAITDGEHIIKEVKGCGSLVKNLFQVRLLFQRDPWSLWNKLFKRTVCYKDLLFPKGNMGEDMALCIQSVMLADKISYIPLAYYNYFDNRGSTTRPIKRSEDYLVKTFNSRLDNTLILVQKLKNIKDKDVQEGLLSIKYDVVSTLFPLSHIKEYRDICFNTFPRIFRKVMLSKEMAFASKFRFMLAWAYMYPRITK